MHANKLLSLGGFLTLCFLIAFLGSFATHASLDPWYQDLAKASWNPPAWVFGPVWTILYVMIAVAGWRLYLSPPSTLRRKALLFYAVQLFLNFAWSFLFFYFQSPLLGLIDISLLPLFIGFTIRAAWSISRVSSFLLIPYFLWTLYAFSLNLAIYHLN